MHATASRILASALSIACCTSLAHAATVRHVGSDIVVTPDAAAPAYQVRLAGPNGFAAELTRLGNEPIAFSSRDKAGWPDGDYRYEIWPIVGVAKRTGTEPVAAHAAPARSVSGSFSIDGGRLFAPASALPETRLDEGMTVKDQVIPDDLIVQGSGCFGFDCVNNENFGVTTILLKENNLRITFDDTSASAGYTTNDWQLTANEQPQGGINKFSLEDLTGAKVPLTVIAGAPTNSVFVDSTGNVGFGTATPGLMLHASKTDTPGLRLEQTGSGGFTPQTWDVGGNEANFFVRDLTGGSRLSFRIRPGAPTSSLDIAASGNVGVGTASPAAKLDVNGNGALLNLTGTDHSFVQFYPDGPTTRKGYFGYTTATNNNLLLANEITGAHIVMLPTGAAGSIIAGAVVHTGIGSGADKLAVAGSIGSSSNQFNVNPGSNFQMIHRSTGGWDFLTDTASKRPLRIERLAPTNQMVIAQTGVGIGIATPTEALHVVGNMIGTGNITIAGTLSQGSDRNSKENFASLDPADVLDKLAALDVTRWNYKADGEKVQHIGPMAQDFYAAFGLGDADTKIAPLDTSGVTIVAIQELNRRLEQRDAQLAERDAEIAALRDRLDRLDAQVAALARAAEPAATTVSADVESTVPANTGL